jgi:amidophosphoribosyltransferase
MVRYDTPPPPGESDKPRDHCGIFGVYGHPRAAQMIYYGLQALQHRGQEGSGIVTSTGEASTGKNHFRVHKDFGLVNDVFRDDSILTDRLTGESGIGHNRYSTAGASDNKLNIQPLMVNYRDGNLAISHNGNLTNFRRLRKELQDSGTIFQTTSDTEIILHLMARSREADQVKQVIEALNRVEGAFSALILTDTALIAARDPYGWRPLALGRHENSFVVASETCAFDIIGATYIRDIRPGEVLVIDRSSLIGGEPRSYLLNRVNTHPNYCIFEYIYFSRPDSKIFGESVDKVRRKLGKALAQEHPMPPADEAVKSIVINVPDSSNTATLGFVSMSNKLGIPAKYEIGLIRSHYVGRTFIQPFQDQRETRVRTKFNTVRGVLDGRRVVIVDDSIVRGTTSLQLIRLIRDAGAREIHFRVTSPPIRFPCHYGMDFPEPAELIANRHNGDTAAIAEELGVDTLGYLSLAKLLESVPHDQGEGYCTACFTGQYPTRVEENGGKAEYEA